MKDDRQTAAGSEEDDLQDFCHPSMSLWHRHFQSVVQHGKPYLPLLKASFLLLFRACLALPKGGETAYGLGMLFN